MHCLGLVRFPQHFPQGEEFQQLVLQAEEMVLAGRQAEEMALAVLQAEEFLLLAQLEEFDQPVAHLEDSAQSVEFHQLEDFQFVLPQLAWWQRQFHQLVQLMLEHCLFED